MQQPFLFLPTVSFLKRQRRRHGIVLRAMSAVLVVSFLFQELSYANPDLKSIDLSFGLSQKNPAEINIPRSIAVVEDVYRTASGSNKTIYLIQDAHVNESAQKNIAKTLDIILKSEPVQYVFLEAGTGNDSLSHLRKYASQEKREEVAKSFLRKGYIQGPDYLDLTSEHSFTLWGVEDKSLYFRGLEDYRFLKDKREHLNATLDKVGRAVKTLKLKLYNPSLQVFDEKRESFLKGDLSLTDYFDVLVAQGQKLSLPLDELFPYLAGLRKVKEKEAGIDFAKAREEELEAFTLLPGEDQKELTDKSQKERNPFVLDAQEHREAKAFYAVLEEKLNRPQTADDRRRRTNKPSL